MKQATTVLDPWRNFKGSKWKKSIDVRDFILNNVTVYYGDESFLEGPTEATKKLWEQVMELSKQEREKGGVLDMDTSIVSTITSHRPGYLNKDLEKIVGFQTDKPFKRALMPFGGIRMAQQSCEAYGYKVSDEVKKIFTEYRKTHNQGVFDVYTEEMKLARKAGIITGLPDAYGRGRIIGDYRRVALYGVDRLIEEKQKDLKNTGARTMTEDIIRLREEIAEQIRALNELKQMALSYGYDISEPAQNAHEAFQWLYFAYLAAIKEQNGAAMSLGRVSTFLDIYIERDLQEGTLTEKEAQELVDHFVMKLRLVKFARTPEYNELFSGDPTWVTESIGGMAIDGRPLVTKNSFRFLHTLDNLGPAPEPNLTVLWSKQLPEAFKEYCAKMSIKTSSIQYENDDLMRVEFGDDYGIACCVSPMRIGKQMQFFGARANLAKALLYAINGGVDEKLKIQVGPEFAPITSEYLDYDEVMRKFDHVLEWLAELYINTLNVIHYMHDKYCYERIEMALHDSHILRTMATGIAGLSVVADSLSAIKYAKVKPIRDENGIAVDFEIEGDFPKYGNNDDRVDQIAVDLVERFMTKLKKHKTYRDSKHTLSILTITSNVVYGKKTGNTPDGRRAGEPFAPGANPLHGRDTKGALASLSSVAKLPFEHALDGISNTFSIVPKALGKEEQTRVRNLVAILDGYMEKGGHHLNINVLNRETLLDAMEHPEKYPQLTIRVSGYAVNFIKLTREQQIDVINRTFHETM
ncbi:MULTISPECIES: formate C-acetyltransferase [unclassified Geobacillus]|uniref:Formate acetyltransferase n=1 Tax=Geobacillus sp. (strain WCH70) TaxID=471223 RepID=C5D9V0_GEOSW|nr:MULTISPECIES: formate C-acetyltransferase [unclassified Geobacillus]PDM39504.1 formate acetyltransferase [Parageobacillus yumthangensis]PUF88092.1 formate C-acetyltransferase [Geobacillus sp. LYN3]TXK87298.1 formate C-acetyltransferase [Geobacillus sp. AYS3]TXK91434.1 formate C-acetyltransferase [Parageobacillus sp. SY1]